MPTTHVVVFPHAGAGPAAYGAWAERLPADWTSQVAHLPGRELRRRDPFPASIQSLAAEIAAAVAASATAPDVPLRFFGHSMGAVIAAETARQLDRVHGRRPDRLVVSGARPPAQAQLAEPLHERPVDELVSLLGALGGTVRRAAADEPFLSYWEPIIRGDLRLCWEYRASQPLLLDVPLVAVTATRDTRASRELMAGWADHSAAGFSLREVTGDHYYLFEPAGHAVVRDALAGCTWQGVRT